KIKIRIGKTSGVFYATFGGYARSNTGIPGQPAAGQSAAVRCQWSKGSRRAVMNRFFLICLSLIQWLRLVSPGIAAETTAPSRDAPKRARVVMVQEPGATVTFNAQPEKIPPMIQRGLTALTGKATAGEAWLSLISTQDTIGVKVYSALGPTSGTRPAVVEAVVESLLAAGLPPRKIVV